MQKDRFISKYLVMKYIKYELMNFGWEVALTSFGIVYPTSRKALAVAKTSLPLYLAY